MGRHTGFNFKFCLKCGKPLKYSPSEMRGLLLKRLGQDTDANQCSMHTMHILLEELGVKEKKRDDS